MTRTVGSVPWARFEDLVDQAVELVAVMTGCQFAIGDAALEIAPLRMHGGNMALGEGEEVGVEESLRRFAESIGLSFHTVRTYRWVASRWPEEQRQEGVSFEVHRILASAEDGGLRVLAVHDDLVLLGEHLQDTGRLLKRLRKPLDQRLQGLGCFRQDRN